MAVIVVIGNTAGLPPTRFMLQAGPDGYIGKSAVAVVFKKTAMRFLASREPIKTPAIDQKNIEVAIVVIVVKGQSAAGCFQQVFIG